jgi:hypothetical protein
MNPRRGAIALASLAVFLLSVVLSAQNPPPQTKKMTKAEEKERDTIYALLATGATPDDLGLTWVREDLLKASGNQQYMPFIVGFDATKAPSKILVVYWRLVAPQAAPAAGAKKDDKKAPPQYAFEGLTPLAVTGGDAANTRVSRSFAALPGTYEMIVVVKEAIPEKAPRNAPPLKTSVLKKTIEVPDLWNGELNTSSVFVGRIDPLPAPLTPQQQMERLYAIGGMEITPEASTKFTKKGELSTFMLIYNPKTDAANKPDVMVEYNFYAKQEGAEKFFNKTNPQNLNAETLPPQFDFAAGHQLQAGQAVPLGSFPEGDYRLEIKVTDKLANKTVTRDVNFSVAGS